MSTTDGASAFRRVDGEGTAIVEVAQSGPLLSSSADVRRVIEACLSMRASSVLLRAEQLPERFFDLSSGEAGEILQKLRTYRIRLAVVRDATMRMSTRFGELMTEEQGRNDFRMFDSREAAAGWLRALGGDS
jgi:hypothetical protein